MLYIMTTVSGDVCRLFLVISGFHREVDENWRSPGLLTQRVAVIS